MSKAAIKDRRGLLYVEGDPASLGLVEQMIAGRPDLLLLRAPSLDAGLRVARSARPEVILLNVDLPGIGALGFMKRVRAEPGLQSTPLLALSANAAPAAVTKALEAGFFHYLIKPVKPEPFLEALDYALHFAAQERSEQNDLPARAKQHSKESL